MVKWRGTGGRWPRCRNRRFQIQDFRLAGARELNGEVAGDGRAVATWQEWKISDLRFQIRWRGEWEISDSRFQIRLEIHDLRFGIRDLRFAHAGMDDFRFEISDSLTRAWKILDSRFQILRFRRGNDRDSLRGPSVHAPILRPGRLG